MRLKLGTLLLLAISLVPQGVTAGGLDARGLLWIPALNLRAPIVDSLIVNRAHQVPDHHVGWLDGTGWIYDDATRVVLGGHNPGVFGAVPQLVPGMAVWVFGARGPVQYRVAWAGAVKDGDWQWLVSRQRPELLLVTCYDGGWWLVLAARVEGWQ